MTALLIVQFTSIIVLDVVVLALPVRVLLRLQISPKKKCQLYTLRFYQPF